MTGHPIVYLEIPATHASAAGLFYSNVFGWQIEANEVYNYVQFRSEGGPNGGFVVPKEGTPIPYKPDSLLVFFATDDIDATLASVERYGGKTVLLKTEIPGIGWWAVFTDPTGNHLALFTPAQSMDN